MERFGEKAFSELQQRKDSGIKLYKADKERIYQELKQKLADLGE